MQPVFFCAIFYLTKIKYYAKIVGASTIVRAPNFYYTILPVFLSSVFCCASCTKIFPKFCAICTLHFGVASSIIISVKGQGVQTSSEKSFKTFKKPIDKVLKICYNIYVR